MRRVSPTASEVASATALKEFLKNRGVDSNYERGDNPPDWVFFVGNERWAVEVTELHPYVVGPDGEPIGLSSVLRPIEENLSAVAPVDSESLQEFDMPIFAGPTPRPRWKREKERLAAHAGGPALIGIRPGTRGGDRVSDHTSLTKQVEYSVSRSLVKKMPRLRQLQLYSRKVLLLKSEFITLAYPNHIPNFLATLKLDKGAIDGVFLVIDSTASLVADPGEVFGGSRLG